MLQCGDVLSALEGARVTRDGDGFIGTDGAQGPAHIGTGVGLALIAVALLGAGYRLLRPTAAALNAAVCLVVALHGSAWIGTCEARLGAALVAALCAALATLCLLRAGLFLVGASAFGLSAMVLYEGLVPVDPTVLGVWGGRGAIFWLTIGGAAIAGAIVAHCGRERVYVFVSCTLGAIGLCAATVLLVPGRVPAWSIVLLFVGSAAAGCATQHWLRTRPPRTEPAHATRV